MEIRILNALGEMLRSKIEYICTCKVSTGNQIFVVTSNRLVLLDCDLERIQSTIEYADIIGIVVAVKRSDLFEIHLKLSVIPIVANDRRNLLQAIENCWKTDYMFRNFSFRKINLYKSDLRSSYKQYPQPAIGYLIEPRFRLKEYQFQLPAEFKKAFQDGVYEHVDNPEVRIVIQITDPLPMSLLGEIGERLNLQFYTENVLMTLIEGLEKAKVPVTSEQVIRTEMEDEAEDKVEIDDSMEFWIIESRPYLKRNNTTMDTSEWIGWEVQARTLQQDIMIIMLRRKHIPPLIETYQEILLVLYGEKLKEQEDINDDLALLKFTIEEDLRVHQLFNVLRGCADSIQGKSVIIEQEFKQLIEMSANTLLYETDTLKYIQKEFDIVPQYIVYGIKYLKVLIQRFAPMDPDLYEPLINEVNQIRSTKQVQGQSNDYMIRFKDFMPMSIEKEDNPTKLLEIFEHTSFVRDKSANEQVRKNIWQQKLSKYLAYCMQNLLPGVFQIKGLVETLLTKNIQNDARDAIMECLDYLLYIVPQEHTEAFRPGILSQSLESLVYNRLTYNQEVFQALVEAEFFSRFYLMTDRQSLYSQVMVYALQTGNTSLKVSICKHVINFNAQVKQAQGLTEQMIGAFKPIAVEILYLFQSKNRTISSLACGALYNLCTNSREFKYIVLKNSGAQQILEKLICNDNYLLHITLKLIASLMAIVQNMEVLLINGLMEYLMNLLAGSQIRGFQYDAAVLVTTCQILNVCLMGEQEIRSIDQLLNMLYDLYKIVTDQYFLDPEDQTNLKSECLDVLCRLSTKSMDIKKKINDELVPYILKQMGTELPSFIEERFVILLNNLMKENKEWCLKWLTISPYMLKNLETYHLRQIVSANYLMTLIQGFRDEVMSAPQPQIKPIEVQYNELLADTKMTQTKSSATTGTTVSKTDDSRFSAASTQKGNSKLSK